MDRNALIAISISYLLSISSKVLIVRLMAVPEFRERFLDLFCVMMATNFTKPRLTNLIEQQTDLIKPAIYEEPYSFFSKDFYEYDVGNGTGGGNEVNIPPLQYFLDQRIYVCRISTYFGTLLCGVRTGDAMIFFRPIHLYV